MAQKYRSTSSKSETEMKRGGSKFIIFSESHDVGKTKIRCKRYKAYTINKRKNTHC